jgi:hypothetical protein
MDKTRTRAATAKPLNVRQLLFVSEYLKERLRRAGRLRSALRTPFDSSHVLMARHP